MRGVESRARWEEGAPDGSAAGRRRVSVPAGEAKLPKIFRFFLACGNASAEVRGRVPCGAMAVKRFFPNARECGAIGTSMQGGYDPE